jgi:hypothetical protein
MTGKHDGRRGLRALGYAQADIDDAANDSFQVEPLLAA